MRWILAKKSNKNILQQLLFARGLRTKKQQEVFLSPDYERDMHDPYLMKNMKKAVKRIMQAINEKQKICIFADYDADGVTAATILTKTLAHLGPPKPIVYIPDRSKEGYGLNKKAIQELAQKKVNLIITVDCGITDISEIKLANKLGLDIIITDHHEVLAKVPNAFAIINPKQKLCKYPFKNLAGCGVAFKLAQGLIMPHGRNTKPCVPAGEQKNRQTFLKWLLDLVAIGTVADCMHLLGENRVIVKYGLIVLSKTRNLGLQSLIRASRIQQSKLSAYSLGFQIGPRLNAAGRMDHANTAYKLLNTDSQEIAEGLAEQLDKKNSRRQQLTDKIVKNIKSRICNEQGELKDQNKKLIFKASKDWPIGVLGLSAGRICDEFFRPVILISKSIKPAKGSGRSLPGLNMVKAITKCDSLLKEYGGHAQAIGLSVMLHNVKKFKIKLTNIINKELKNKKLVPELYIDAEVRVQDLNLSFCEKLKKLEPFGQGNHSPKFLIKNLQIKEMRCVGNGEKHLRMILSDSENPRKQFKAIGFNCAQLGDDLQTGDLIDLVFKLEIDEWNNRKSVQLKIIDLKKGGNAYMRSVQKGGD